ncbi:hypothetical protein EON80_33160 [bacterium]|nr:MAG: hypothetical protein EON80_33160 [bacterium]
MKTRFFLPVLGALCCTLAGAAHADLKWTETMTFGGETNPETGEKMVMTVNKWIKKEATRSETSFSMGPIKMVNTDIMHCDTQETLILDADLGKETISNIETRHYSLKMKNTVTGCAGKGTTESTMEMWVADIRMPAPCQQVDYKTGLAMALRQDPACEVAAEFKGDTVALQKVFDGFVMRMKMGGSKDVPELVKEVTMLSQAELDDTPFTVPADWKKVSEKQLQNAKQKAMMNKMMENMKNMGG